MGKRMDLAEKLVGQLIAELGPRRFMIALNNATARGGALLEAPGVALDNQDLMLSGWHREIDEMIALGKWMEGDDSLAEYFIGRHMAEKHGTRPKPSDRLKFKPLHEMRREDVTVHRISTVEALIYEITGEKVFINWCDSSDSKSIPLRGPLVAVMQHICHEMEQDQEIYDVMSRVALIVAADGVLLTHGDNVYPCSEIYEGRKQRGRRVEDSDEHPLCEDEKGKRLVISEDDLDALILEILGVSIFVDMDADIDGDMKLNITRKGLKELLRSMVDNNRSIGYCRAALEDLTGCPFAASEDDSRHVAGPDYPSGIGRQKARQLQAQKSH